MRIMLSPWSHRDAKLMLGHMMHSCANLHAFWQRMTCALCVLWGSMDGNYVKVKGKGICPESSCLSHDCAYALDFTFLLAGVGDNAACNHWSNIESVHQVPIIDGWKNLQHRMRSLPDTSAHDQHWESSHSTFDLALSPAPIHLQLVSCQVYLSYTLCSKSAHIFMLAYLITR